MGRLADAAFADRALRQAWSDVLEDDSADGTLARGVARFEDRAEDRLSRLVADLAWGSYAPGDLAEVRLDDGRCLQVPTVADRVVARAILAVVGPVVDPHLGPASYAYRPGLGVRDAVQRVVAFRDEGLGWVARADVDDCFPSVPVGRARRLLGALVSDDELLAVVDLMLDRRVVDGRGRRRRQRGLPQGCPLSPLLANLVLAEVDAALLDEGFAVVRYADDIVVAAASQDEAWDALRHLARAVEEAGMGLGAEDTAVMSFEDGFAFLGEDFGPRYPVRLDDIGVEEPERKVLYVGLQGGRVRTRAGRLIVETDSREPAVDVPKGKVRRIVCFGAVGVSAGVRSWAMSSGVDVVFASRRGAYLGSMVGTASPRPSRIRAQIVVGELPQSRAIQQAIVAAKISKQAVVLQRFGRREHAEIVQPAIHQLRQCLLLLPDADSAQEAMGIEGAAAAAYFPAFGALFPPDLTFSLRSRQPPVDVANSALSFLYTVLLGECVTAAYAAGLDPHIGVLHTDQDQRPSLALDLLEEFRPYVVDQVVIRAARSGSLQASHARHEEGRSGVMLTKAGRESLLTGYERRMLTRTSGALPEFAGTIRRHLYRQAQRLAAAITDPTVEWSGLSWRR